MKSPYLSGLTFGWKILSDRYSCVRIEKKKRNCNCKLLTHLEVGLILVILVLSPFPQKVCIPLFLLASGYTRKNTSGFSSLGKCHVKCGEIRTD